MGIDRITSPGVPRLITGLKGTTHNYGMIKERVCGSCDKTYTPYHPRQKYCCEECQRIAARKQTKKWAEHNATTDYVKNQNLRKYGLTLDSFNSMVDERDSKCDICKQESKLYVDHCHSEGHVRGLLCTQCNTAIGLFKEDPIRILEAISYLKKEYSAV